MRLPTLLIARGIAYALILVAGLAAAQPAFDVRISAPAPLQSLLERHLEIVRWQRHERMTAEEFNRLFRASPQEIRDLLSTEGYYGPVIDARLDDEAGRLTARFAIDPGAPVIVEAVRVDFVGALMAADSAVAAKAEVWRAAWALLPGQVFRHVQWEEGKRELLRALARDRYPLAVIAKSEATVDPQKHTASLVVLVDSGPAAVFGELRIEGLSRYSRSIVENLNPIRPGEPYTYLKLQEFQTRLVDSGYFAGVTVDAPARSDGIAPVRVWVEERESRRLAFGIGYSTDTGTRLQGEFRQLDFLGRGLQLGTRLKLETRAHSARVDLFFPTDATGYRDRLIAETERKDVQGTDTDKVVFTAGRARKRGDIETDVSINYITENERVTGASRDSRAAVTGNYSYTIRRTNHPLFPDRGYLLNAQVGGAPGILVAEQTFLRVYGKAVRYFKAGEDGVLTLRAELGSVYARGTRDVPSDYLFRTGGDQTVRGYAYQSLGVHQGTAVTGGRALGVLSAEYTHWVSEAWGIAVFYDAGNAADDFRSFHLARGYGAGARWRSPVGPLNLDVAHGRDEGKFRLHFSVGLAF